MARIQRGWPGCGGMPQTGLEGPRYLLGLRGGVAHFAVEVAGDGDDLTRGDARRFVDVRTAATLLSAEDAGNCGAGTCAGGLARAAPVLRGVRQPDRASCAAVSSARAGTAGQTISRGRIRW